MERVWAWSLTRFMTCIAEIAAVPYCCINTYVHIMNIALHGLASKWDIILLGIYMLACLPFCKTPLLSLSSSLDQPSVFQVLHEIPPDFRPALGQDVPRQCPSPRTFERL